MSRSPSALHRLAMAGLAVLVLAPAGPAGQARAEGEGGPVLDISAPVLDIGLTVESIDGDEAQQQRGAERTVVLTGRVLFPEDEARITAAARRRLAVVARDVVAAEATGVVEVSGYTDDQGSATYGLRLSRRRASAVSDVLRPLIAATGARIVARGYGEADPRLPNLDADGNPIPENRARNRRVEITFRPG